MRIGVDVGGTFTDAVIVKEGRVWRGKASTTPGEWTTGIVSALEAACSAAGLELQSALASTQVFAHGSTIVTNALTEGVGVRTALFATAGFGDVLAIARSARRSTLDLQQQIAPTELVRSVDIIEVKERIAANGTVVFPLDPRDAVDRAGDLSHVDAMAVALLFSYKNPSHERSLAAELTRRNPGKAVVLSSEVHPLMREYERTVTTVLTASIEPIVGDYLAELQSMLSHLGLTSPILIMQSDGILVTVEQAKRTPLSLYQSGPAGGVVAAQWAASSLDIRKAVCCDMGGTSFDVSLLFDSKPLVRGTTMMAGHRAGLRTLDIRSIGAGGGSRLRVQHGLPRVGPDSAGSRPGPACYGAGGLDPTVTDALVCLGLIPARTFLSGSILLDEGAAVNSLRPLANVLQDANGSSAIGSSESRGVAVEFLRLAIEEMAHAIRSTAADSGHDPAEFAMIAFGGAVGLVAAHIAEILGITDVVIPLDCSVFSAFGLAIAEPAYVRVLGTNWMVRTDPWDELADVFVTLEQDLTSYRPAHEVDEWTLRWELDIRLRGQVEHLTIPIETPEGSDEWRQALLAEYRSTYERVHGVGSFWHLGEQAAQVVAVRGIAGMAAPDTEAAEEYSIAPPRTSAATHDVGASEARETLVWWPERQVIPFAHGDSVQVGSVGPLSITVGDSTIYVPMGWSLVSREQDLMMLRRAR